MKRWMVALLLAGCSHEHTMSDGGADLAGDMTTPFVPGQVNDPVTCDDAKAKKSYIGCDYWPTVTANPVWSVFDYAVVVSNPGSGTANVTVTGGALTAPKTAQVPAGQLVKIGLPWVKDLKGADADSNGVPVPLTASVLSKAGAYHLVADVPVLVYQFNALEYEAGSGDDLNGVAWSTCPQTSACKSYTNDASLLLPSTAMTANYVIASLPGDDDDESAADMGVTPLRPTYAVITATQDATMVALELGATGDIVASTDGTIAASTGAGTKVQYLLNAGDAIELVTRLGSAYDLTGSIVQATSPVQVIVGNPCTTNPRITAGSHLTCDHVEESVLPVETWGTKYVVTAPSGPNGVCTGAPCPIDMNASLHSVRIYGGVTAANLTYSTKPDGAPDVIMPGQVVKLDTDVDFYVEGDHAFAVSTEQMSGEIVDPHNGRGDPSLSFFAAVEQYRAAYTFLAPTDYDVSWVDIAMLTGTQLMLDGQLITDGATSIGSGYSVMRLKLGPGNNGAHTLVGTQGFGIQVEGYGAQTSYQYPGGLDLDEISGAPPPIL